jgi:hypothetical protein
VSVEEIVIVPLSASAVTVVFPAPKILKESEKLPPDC